jgi:hypothetical protein
MFPRLSASVYKICRKRDVKLLLSRANLLRHILISGFAGTSGNDQDRQCESKIKAGFAPRCAGRRSLETKPAGPEGTAQGDWRRGIHAPMLSRSAIHFKIVVVLLRPAHGPRTRRFDSTVPRTALAQAGLPAKLSLLAAAIPRCADVAELADALDSKSGTRKSVWVRPPPSAPF